MAGAWFIMNKNTILGTGSSPSPPAPVTSSAPKPSGAKGYADKEGTITGNAVPAQLLVVSNTNLGPGNFGDEGPDEGYGFSRAGGPVHANGKADDGTGAVGNNKVKGLTIAMLPGPCETKPYKGLVQYKKPGSNLSASADSCTHAKQYFLYKFGLGDGGGGGTAKPAAASKKKKKAKFAYAYNAGMVYTQFSPISTLYNEY